MGAPNSGVMKSVARDKERALAATSFGEFLDDLTDGSVDEDEITS